MKQYKVDNIDNFVYYGKTPVFRVNGALQMSSHCTVWTCMMYLC